MHADSRKVFKYYSVLGIIHLHFVGLISSSEETLSDGAFGSFPEESVAMNDGSSITFPGGRVSFS